MQAAEPRHGYHFATCFGAFLGLTASRRSLCQTEMLSVVVVVTDVLSHQAFQLLLVQNNAVIKHVSAAVAHPTLGQAVLPWTLEAGPLRLNAKALHRRDDFFIEVCPARSRSSSEVLSQKEKFRAIAE
jgi:hypothetical protein